MRRLFVALALVALPAFAGEKYLGIIVSGAGADTTNSSTAAPFAIAPGAKITMVCTAAAFICAQPPQGGSVSTTCTASLTGSNPGLPVTANEKFPTSVSTQHTTTVSSTRSAIVRIVSTTAVNCIVWERTGTE